MKKFIFKLFIFIFFEIFLNLFFIIFFKNILFNTEIIFPYAINKFNIVQKYPLFWKYLKYYFFISNFISNYIIYNSIYKRLNKIKLHSSNKNISSTFNENELNIVIGNSINNEKIFISEKGLYQNILITGTIGSGKTSSAIIPFTYQLLEKNSNFPMLILDVKGNLYKNLLPKIIKEGRKKDLIVLTLNSKYTYNPLHKPHLKPSLLANRLKNILKLFSPETSESYWLDKVEQLLTESIKFIRLYNDGYVTFEEIHHLITDDTFYNSKLLLLKNKFQSNLFSKKQLYDLSTCIDFFEKEFFKMDSRNLSIIKSEVTRITNLFISDYDVLKTFCPKKENLNFLGFDFLLKNNKILILNMNIFEYKNLSKLIAAYLKIDFQTEVLIRLAKKQNIMPSVFICDEYHEFITANDSDFFAQSREAKCINIVSTQSYTSLLNTLHNESNLNSILQNLVNKLWFRTDDILTIESAQKQIGKEEKKKTSKTISENAKRTTYNFFTNSLKSEDSNISESLNTYSQSDFIFDTKFFTQNLNTFNCLAFISNGVKILPPQKVILTPYFEKNCTKEVNAYKKQTKF